MTISKRRIIFICCTIFLFIAIPALIFYTQGYRITSGFKIVKTGGLSIYSPVKDSQIFVNEKKKKTGLTGRSLFLQDLTPKTYSVLVAKDGYYPWAKDLEVRETLVTEAKAFLMPTNAEGNIIKEDELEDKEILMLLNNFSKIPDEFKNEEERLNYFNRFTKDGKQQLWWDPETNKVQVKWLGDQNLLPFYFCSSEEECNPVVDILNPISSIKNVDFYPGRTDLIIVAQQNVIATIEIDGRSIRNWQPIYKGKDPVFVTYKNKKDIYILDDNNLLKIELE